MSGSLGEQTAKQPSRYKPWQEAIFMVLVSGTVMALLSLFHSFRYLIGR